jgi:hypothetical protein
MIRLALSKMLTTIQNRQPLPSEGRSSGCHLHLEHHVVCDLFQVAYDPRLPPGTCVLQRIHQPLQGRSHAIHFWR